MPIRIAPLVLLALAGLLGACSSTEGATDEDVDAFVSFLNFGAQANYIVLASPEEATEADALVLGRFRRVLGTATEVRNPERHQPTYLLVEVEVEEVLAWNTAPATDPKVVTVMIRYPPLVSEDEIAETFQGAGRRC